MSNFETLNYSRLTRLSTKVDDKEKNYEISSDVSERHEVAINWNTSFDFPQNFWKYLVVYPVVVQ